MMPRTLPCVLCAALLLTGARALAEAPTYVIGWWDGAAGRPGVWFRAEGPAIPDGVALQPVARLEPGRVVQPAPGRIVVSAELALLLGVPPRTLTLLRLAAPDLPPLYGAAYSAVAAVADEPSAVAAPGGTPQERIVTLLAELQELTAEATRADAALLAASTEQAPSDHGSPAPAVAAPAPRRGGLVPFLPAGAEP
jgi:hypothetical protein